MDKELFPISGVVVRKLQTQWGEKNGKKFSRTTFIVKPYDGGKDLFITKFGKFDAELITKDVKFNATKFNETSYTVQGEIEVVEDVKTPEAPEKPAQEVVQETTTSEAPKRGRPKKVESQAVEPKSELITETPVASDDVLAMVKENIQDAKKLIEELKLEVNLLDLADMIGRTRVGLRIERNKDNRMSQFRK